MSEKTKNKNDEAIQECYKWFDSDRNAKKYIQDELEEAYRIYNGDHWSLKDPLGRPLRTDAQKASRPNTVENFVFSLTEGLVAEFSEDVDIIDYPVEQGDDDTATVMTELKKFVLYKNRIKAKREHYMRNFFLYGTAIWHPHWDPTWRGGKGPNKWVGDIRVDSLHPQVVFPDSRCRGDIEEGQRIHKAYYRTIEYVKNKFDKEVMPDTISSSIILGEDEVDRYYDGNDQEVLVVETWYKGEPLFKSKGDPEGEGLHVVWWAGDSNPTYLHHENFVYYEPDEDPKFPFIFRVRYPRENSVWGYGEAHFLKSPQIVLNKTTELILEGHMHYSLGQTFYRPGAITPKQEKFLKQFGTLPNMYFAVNNLDDIKRLHGKGVDASLPAEANRLQRAMEGIIGRHDISQGRTPGSVVAFRALDLLAARARIRLRSAETAIISAYEDLGNYMNHLITKFYTESRAYRILGDNAERTEYFLINTMTGEEMPFTGQIPPGYMLETRNVSSIKYGMFNIDDIKKVYAYDINTGTSEVFPYNDEVAEAIDMMDLIKSDEESEMEISVEYEVYCPQMDVQCKVSTSMPSDRTFYMEMAKEMLMAQLIDEETFWYVLGNGKFPPYETIMNKRKKEMAAVAEQEASMAEMQAQQAPQEAPQQAPQQGGGELDPNAMLQQIFSDRPDLWEKFNQLTPEAQEQVTLDIMGEHQSGARGIPIEG